MSQIVIQSYIVSEIKTNHLAHLRKGNTIAKRDERSRARWVGVLVARGYSDAEAIQIFADARDVAVLELNAA